MNAPTKIYTLESALLVDVNMSAIIEREGIYQVRHYLSGDRYSVTLHDGRRGIGGSVGEALAKARAS